MAASPRAGRSVSGRSGVIPEPTVKVRMKETARQAGAILPALETPAVHLRAFSVGRASVPEQADIMKGLLTMEPTNEQGKKRLNTKKLTTLGMLAALAIVLVALVHFPLLPAAPFLEYDPADIPIFLGTFLFGPAAGLALTAVVSLIQGLTVSAGSGPIGILMHFLATGTFVLLAGWLYHHKPSRKRAILALTVGILSMTAVMCVCNLIFTPLFLGSSLSEVAAMLVPVIAPFNLLKAAINSQINNLVYKPNSPQIHTPHKIR